MLSELQQRIARVVSHADVNRELILAGGGALIVRGLVERVTHDLDLFAESQDAADRLAPSIENALVTDGLSVHRVREGPGFARWEVRSDDAVCFVDVGAYARLFPPEPGELIQTASDDELAADKVLALFDRAEARDFIDVHALANRYGHDRLLSLAELKDAGFDRSVFADMLGQISRLEPSEFDVRPQQLESIRRFFEEWRRELGK